MSAIGAALSLGREFAPRLAERDVLVQASRVPSASSSRGGGSDAAATIYGDDFAMERTAQQVAAVLNSVDGAAPAMRRP